MKKVKCGNCVYWKKEPGSIYGICVDAVERARKVVPDAVYLSTTRITAQGGRDCPCFKETDNVAKLDRRPTCV